MQIRARILRKRYLMLFSAEIKITCLFWKRTLNLETREVRAAVCWSYLCYLLRFWLKEAFFLGQYYSLRCLIM